MAFGSLASSAGLCHGASRSALWLPLDLVLEDAMDGYQVEATSAIERISGKELFIFLPLVVVFKAVISFMKTILVRINI